MPTSTTDKAGNAPVCVVFADEAGALGRWLRLDGGRLVERGDSAEQIAQPARIVLAVPGDQVTVHWRELEAGLAPAQAAAAARLMLADSSAEPLADMHVAVGRAEDGRTPIALVRSSRVAGWLAEAAAAGFEADAVVPTPLLLPAPATGFVRRDRGSVADYRGPASAFSLEPEVAETILGDAPVQALDERAFEAALCALAAEPPLDLRQGPFARRRPWRLDDSRARRIGVFAVALALLSLAVQVATILSYTFAADRAEAEAEALSNNTAGGVGPGFGPAASVLFEAVRATPNAELARIDYRPDGTLLAAVTTDSPATLAALQARIEAGGLAVEPGPRANAAGRTATELRIRIG